MNGRIVVKSIILVSIPLSVIFLNLCRHYQGLVQVLLTKYIAKLAVFISIFTYLTAQDYHFIVFQGAEGYNNIFNIDSQCIFMTPCNILPHGFWGLKEVSKHKLKVLHPGYCSTFSLLGKE